MPSVLAVFDGFGWHAIRDLESVRLWQSLMCYQQKHLWLIGHIRTHHWAVVCVHIRTQTHTHTHTHTYRRALFLSHMCMHVNYTLALAV